MGPRPFFQTPLIFPNFYPYSVAPPFMFPQSLNAPTHQYKKITIKNLNKKIMYTFIDIFIYLLEDHTMCNNLYTTKSQ